MNKANYISEFEELLKIKEFHEKKMKMPFDCTYEQIAKSLKREYNENITEKINRWIDITHIPYFENVISVTYYLQAKMLYRDGFYEAAIMLTRSICEMVSYDLLSKTTHPFGDIELIEVPSYRVFINYLAIPKSIVKDDFNAIISSIDNLDDKNFIKSSYVYDKQKKDYSFKIKNGKEKKNLERFLKIFKETNFNEIDNFHKDTYKLLHEIYDTGNLYVHAKKTANNAKSDALDCLNKLTHILSDIYGVKSSLIGKTIKSGYSDFPDICKGMNFAPEVAASPDDAKRIYLNIPHEKYLTKIFEAVGNWSGEWKNERGEIKKGILTLVKESAEHINANIKYTNNDIEKTEPLEIKLFGNYFHMKGFDNDNKIHKKNEHLFFELEWFNDNLLIGENLDYEGKVVFKRIKK